MNTGEFDNTLLDDAARAAWLYYVGGRTQDEIARVLGVSRQRAQRLISRAVADGLVRVRIEHPIARLMDIATRVREKYALEHVRVAPDVGVDGNLRSVSSFAARMLEEVLSSRESRVIGFGTGRALRATIEQLSKMQCQHHRLISVIGNIAPDGTASVYDVLMRVADLINAPHYPLPTPLLAENREERELYMKLTAVQHVHRLAEKMDVVFIGIGQFDNTAPMLLDGFLSASQWQEFRDRGVVGEICGRLFDGNGNYVQSSFTERMTSYQISASQKRSVVAIASGKSKIEPIRIAMKGKLISSLITDEPTALALL